MTNNLPSIKQDTAEVLSKTKNLMGIANKILAKKDELSLNNLTSEFQDTYKASENNEFREEETREETIDDQDAIISKLSMLSEAKTIKKYKMSIQPINEIWAWSFKFSENELDIAYELIARLSDLRKGDFIAPVFNIVNPKNSSCDFNDDIPF